jgi:hypothetical protein
MFSQTRTKSPRPERLVVVHLNLPCCLIRTVPVGNVLVGDSGGNVEHDDTALSVDVVSITQTSELLLSRGIPDIELNVTQVLIPNISRAQQAFGGVVRILC